MLEFSIRNKHTGEEEIIFGYSLAGALRAANLSADDWVCWHIFGDFEEKSVW